MSLQRSTATEAPPRSPLLSLKITKQTENEERGADLGLIPQADPASEVSDELGSSGEAVVLFASHRYHGAPLALEELHHLKDEELCSPLCMTSNCGIMVRTCENAAT